MSNAMYDIVIIGGGIQGAGVAQAAAAAGYNVALLEKKGVGLETSSRSSKLIHGGLRYLESGQFALVRKALKERKILLNIAPHLVRPVPFYIPIYKHAQRKAWQIRLGLSLYALLAGFERLARFKKLSSRKAETMIAEGLRQDNLTSVFQYWDAQTDDVDLTQAVMQSAVDLSAELIFPSEFISAEYVSNQYQLQYQTNNETTQLSTRAIVNASGPWVNDVLKRITPAPSLLDMELVQGTHIIIDTPALDGVYYLEAPQDKRAVFVMPWKDKTMIGTTETHFTGSPDQVQATAGEIEYLQSVYQHYFPDNDFNVMDSFAGLRVLPKSEHSYFHRPRDTVLHMSLPGLLTLYGGKLTGYRATAQQVMVRLSPFLPKKTILVKTEEIMLG
ncbi:MAG: glycerol-3-phosphate dehydrogenase/oxidase [Gammaproteobacteria bacterium]|nr:glycerol-3-phosphate dehydrogenase/oxidase [Gammaproteobacteria bacterium]